MQLGWGKRRGKNQVRPAWKRDLLISLFVRRGVFLCMTHEVKFLFAVAEIWGASELDRG
jgi:hypothetical protein